ncbi:hypothetical protein [Herbaspirillum frisingense]|uniref:Uncharacterized protein n=1 Tax=Herbaspirillum frisingense TaxID=92645 RepID=A0ABU1PK96_9BURK|nr:hypothetical protein [Herbaspirillum frisingense]MDR6585543.1 hypothetical protein [Herbaspirillum frisingense]
MKEGTIHSLIVGKTLFEEASRQIKSGDRYLATAGLITIQDCLEIVLLALLSERDVDQGESLEKKKFDELVAALKVAGVRVPKTGTLRALNKERVVAKHYGQLVEPITANNYLAAAELAIDDMCRQVIGKGILEIFLHDLLQQSESKDYLIQAQSQISQRLYLGALYSIRQAIFVEIEHEYDISSYAQKEFMSYLDPSLVNSRPWFQKSPLHCRDPHWIAAHVQAPVDFIQIDYEYLRRDALLWGLIPSDVENLLRLTPRSYKANGNWHYELNSGIRTVSESQENATFCLDRAIHIIKKLQQYKNSHKWLWHFSAYLVDISPGSPIFRSTSTLSGILGYTVSHFEYKEFKRVTGFDQQVYIGVQGRDPSLPEEDGSSAIFGFVRLDNLLSVTQ